MKLQKKNLLAQKRSWRIRKTVRGTAARPRLALKMTHVHLYAQAIDDDKGVTLPPSPPLTALPKPEFPNRRTPPHFQTGF